MRVHVAVSLCLLAPAFASRANPEDQAAQIFAALRAGPAGDPRPQIGQMLAALDAAGLHNLGLAGTRAGENDLQALAERKRVGSVRRLDLSRNPTLDARAMRTLSRSAHLTGLRSLDLTRCRLAEAEVYHLTRAAFWPGLVELDLRENPISEGSVRHLLDVPPPADLVALLLDGSRLGEPARADLRRHYGDAVLFHTTAAPE